MKISNRNLTYVLIILFVVLVLLNLIFPGNIPAIIITLLSVGVVFGFIFTKLWKSFKK